MKKLVIVLIIAILIVASVVGVSFYNGKKKEKNTNGNNQIVQTEQYYGNRGNISQAEKIKFLSKDDEYLIGMMGLPVSNNVTEFSNENMIKFALNIAVERYSNILTEKKDKNGVRYLVPKEVINAITDEYFDIKEVTFDVNNSEYYSKANKAFLYGINIEKTLYYYPVDMQTNGDNKEIIVDAIFVKDNQDDSEIESAKYEGKYQKEDVDNTVKFIFNKSGKLVSYQYQ